MSEKVSKAVSTWWSPVITVIGFVFACGIAYSTSTSNGERIDRLERRQEHVESNIDGRLRAVETGVATLLERTKPK